MTLFVLLVLSLSLIAAAFVALPLVRARAGSPRAFRVAALSLLLLFGAGAGLYGWLGSRAWTATAGQSPPDQTIPVLARHLEHEPKDLSGWLNLGQAYEAIGNYSLALRCFERANRLAGGESAAALAGMAEALLMSDDPSQATKAEELLEHALRVDPHSPKALFYSAVAAYRDGRLAVARERFEAMLSLGPPESIRVALQRQIDDIDAQMKAPPGAAAAGVRAAGANTGAGAGASASSAPPAGGTAAVAAGTSIHLHVTINPGLSSQVPADAALFVFVRAPAGGPPLAVKRLTARLPQDVDLSAADAMVSGRAIEPGQEVSVVARISASGNPLPQSGDLSGEIRTVAGKSDAQALQIDRRNP
jgi:cytochrome c-type biogenesis protein CcmH